MDTYIGHATHYYSRLGVAVIELIAELKLGDTILILGHTTDFEQRVSSLEVDHRKVQSIPAGEVALKVDEPVRKGDRVYRVVTAAEDQAASVRAGAF